MVGELYDVVEMQVRLAGKGVICDIRRYSTASAGGGVLTGRTLIPGRGIVSVQPESCHLDSVIIAGAIIIQRRIQVRYCFAQGSHHVRIEIAAVRSLCTTVSTRRACPMWS
jgi:hypothetical protein